MDQLGCGFVGDDSGIMRQLLSFRVMLAGALLAGCSAGAAEGQALPVPVPFSPFTLDDVPPAEAAAMADALRACLGRAPGAAQSCEAPLTACMESRTREQCLHQAANAWALIGEDYLKRIHAIARLQGAIEENQAAWFRYAETNCRFAPQEGLPQFQREEVVRCEVETTAERVAELHGIMEDNVAVP